MTYTASYKLYETSRSDLFLGWTSLQEELMYSKMTEGIRSDYGTLHKSNVCLAEVFL